MTISHEQAIVADHRFSFRHSASVHSYKVADGSIVANDYQAFFAFEFEILWNTSDNGTRKNPAVLADSHSFEYSYVRADCGSLTYFYVFIYCYEWFDYDRTGNFSIWMNVCKWLFHKII